MFQTLSRSWELVKASYGVLKQDKELIWFPILSTVAIVIVTAVLLLPMGALGVFESLATAESSQAAAGNGQGEVSGGMALILFIMAFLFYFIMYTIVIYSNTALIGAALIRLDGGDPTVRDGLQIANSRLSVIFGYAAIAATVGMILQAIRGDEDNILGSIVAGILDFAWNLITFLVVPVLVVENVGPIQAIKRSSSLLRSTWGENITGSFAMGIIQFIATLLVGLVVGLPLILIANALGSGIALAIAIGVLVLAIAAISFFFSALNGIFQAALYKYATDADHSKVSQFFDERLVAGAFQPK